MNRLLAVLAILALCASCSVQPTSTLKPHASGSPSEEEDPPPGGGGEGQNWTFNQEGGLSGSYPFRRATWVRVDGPEPRPKAHLRVAVRFESIYGAVRFDGVRKPEGGLGENVFGCGVQAPGAFSDTIGTLQLYWSSATTSVSGSGRWIECNWRRQDENISLPAQVRLIMLPNQSTPSPYMANPGNGSQEFPVQFAEDTLIYTLQPAGPPP